MKKLLWGLALCGNAAWAGAILDTTPYYTASEYLDLGDADAGTILDGSDFLSFGEAPGAFLVTANTDFDSTGSERLLFLLTDSPPASSNLAASPESEQAYTPEPGTMWESAVALFAIGWAVWRLKVPRLLPIS
jgi:hypothetical protein